MVRLAVWWPWTSMNITQNCCRVNTPNNQQPHILPEISSRYSITMKMLCASWKVAKSSTNHLKKPQPIDVSRPVNYIPDDATNKTKTWVYIAQWEKTNQTSGNTWTIFSEEYDLSIKLKWQHVLKDCWIIDGSESLPLKQLLCFDCQFFHEHTWHVGSVWVVFLILRWWDYFAVVLQNQQHHVIIIHSTILKTWLMPLPEEINYKLSPRSL